MLQYEGLGGYNSLQALHIQPWHVQKILSVIEGTPRSGLPCRYIFVEYGPMELDLNLRVRINELEEWLRHKVWTSHMLDESRNYI